MKSDNFCDILFAFLNTKPLRKKNCGREVKHFDRETYLEIISYTVLVIHFQPNYQIQPCNKCTFKQILQSSDLDYNFCSFVYFFVNIHVVGTHLNCLDKSRQFKRIPTTYAFIKKNKKKYCISIIQCSPLEVLC